MDYHFQVNMRKGNRNKNKIKKFIRRNKTGVTAAAAVLLIVFTSFGSIYNGRGQASAEKAESAVVIVVEQGDTLWSIAKAHRSTGQDIRSLVFEIRTMNNLQDAVIYPGQQLIIPR